MPAKITQYGGLSGGWAQTGRLRTGDSSSEVGLAADFPTSQVYTLQFGVQTQEGLAFDAIADIAWSTEGNTVKRQISIGNGVSISAPAQGVSVRVTDRTPGLTDGTEYTVTIKCTPGERINDEQPPVLVAIDPDNSNFPVFTIPPSDFITVPVPQNAGAISVNIAYYPSTPAVLTDADISVVHIAGIVQNKVYSPVNDPDGWVPLAPNTTTINVVNHMPALGGLDILCVVTFGIDG